LSEESLICPTISIHQPLGRILESTSAILSLPQNARDVCDGPDRQSRCRGRWSGYFREEGLYSFRFDLNGDAREDVTFKIRFGEVTHSAVDEHRHVQSFEVRRATGQIALKGADGELLVVGRTGQIAMTESGTRVFAGLAPDLFVGDAAALGVFRNALYKEEKFAPEAFQNRKNFLQDGTLPRSCWKFRVEAWTDPKKLFSLHYLVSE
jgi:hypothetical protein